VLSVRINRRGGEGGGIRRHLLRVAGSFIGGFLSLPQSKIKKTL
jgi:hypothetical protein